MCCKQTLSIVPLAFNSYGKLTIQIWYSDDNNIFQPLFKYVSVSVCVKMVLEIFCCPVFFGK